MTGLDPMDIAWCRPCLTGQHDRCQPVPWCSCPVELEHDEENPVTPEPHDYLSTRCHHGDHGGCRLRCKVCAALCRCSCHTVKAQQ